jgi:hypothetical protein
MDFPTVQPVFHSSAYNPIRNLRQTIQPLGKHFSTIPFQSTAANVSERNNLRIRNPGNNPGNNPDDHLFRHSRRKSVFERPVRRHWQHVEHWQCAFHKYCHNCQLQSCLDEL